MRAAGLVPTPHCGHAVQLYRNEEDLIGEVVAHLVAGAALGHPLVVIATPEHRAVFTEALGGAGIDGHVVVLDAGETLSRFMVDGRPDRAAFERSVGGVVRAAGGLGTVRAYGEMVAVLWEEGNVTGAIELEQLWNDLGRELSFSLLCGYPAHLVTDPPGAFEEVYGLHDAVVGGAPLLGDPDVRRWFLGTPDCPRHARTFVAAALREWGQGALVDDALLIVSELATNAILHARSDFSVALRRHGRTVRIAVGDRMDAAPTPRAPDVARPGGRGLPMIAELATRWGHDLAAGGKVVWADLSAPLTAPC